jgi:hypothetical protein
MYSVFVHGEGCGKDDVKLCCGKVKEVNAILGDICPEKSKLRLFFGTNWRILTGQAANFAVGWSHHTPHPHSLHQPTAPSPKRACTFPLISE